MATHIVEEFACPGCTGRIYVEWTRAESKRDVACPSCAYDTVNYLSDIDENLLGVEHGQAGWRGPLERTLGVRRLTRDVDSKVLIQEEPKEIL